jgi:DNA-binding LacI/PurR family transcriptional regulator
VDIPELPAERYSVEAGAKAMRTYLAATPADQRIDLLMCENDVLATGAMDVIRSEFGLRVPADIAVIGFDNAGYAATPAYDLTTYEQPIDAMVQATVEMIVGRCEKKTIQLRGRLVPRSSA